MQIQSYLTNQFALTARGLLDPPLYHDSCPQRAFLTFVPLQALDYITNYEYL